MFGQKKVETKNLVNMSAAVWTVVDKKTRWVAVSGDVKKIMLRWIVLRSALTYALSFLHSFLLVRRKSFSYLNPIVALKKVFNAFCWRLSFTAEAVKEIFQHYQQNAVKKDFSATRMRWMKNSQLKLQINAVEKLMLLWKP